MCRRSYSRDSAPSRCRTAAVGKPGEVLDLRGARPAAPLRCAPAAPRCGRAERRRARSRCASTPRLQAKREPERLRGIEVDGLADDIRRKRCAFTADRLEPRHERSGTPGRMRSRNLSVNWSAAGRRSDDDADVAPAVFLSQKLRLGRQRRPPWRPTRRRDIPEKMLDRAAHGPSGTTLPSAFSMTTAAGVARWLLWMTSTPGAVSAAACGERGERQKNGGESNRRECSAQGEARIAGTT